MRKAFVVGHPISHSRSPIIHNYWLKQLKLSGSYERIDILPECFTDFMKYLKDNEFIGGNITVPFKESAFKLVDSSTLRAQRIGAVNTIVVSEDGTVHGDNTDAPGFIAHVEQTLGSSWFDRADLTATVIGAGGAARAVVVGLIERGVRHLRVANRTVERAKTLSAIDAVRIEPINWADLPHAFQSTDLLVNTTSLGMVGNSSLELDINRLPDTAAVADIVYVPLETRLLASARHRQLLTVDGLGMLLHQAVPGFESWFGVRPKVTADLERLIAADLMR